MQSCLKTKNTQNHVVMFEENSVKMTLYNKKITKNILTSLRLVLFTIIDIIRYISQTEKKLVMKNAGI